MAIWGPGGANASRRAITCDPRATPRPLGGWNLIFRAVLPGASALPTGRKTAEQRLGARRRLR
jgi:hypothetical protein